MPPPSIIIPTMPPSIIGTHPTKAPPPPNVVKASPAMDIFLSDLSGPRTFLPSPPLSPTLLIINHDLSPGNCASNNIPRIRPYIRGITPPCTSHTLRERENDGYMGPVWDNDRSGMYAPSEKAARRLERRLGVGEDVERVKRRKRREVDRRKKEKEKEEEEERARTEAGDDAQNGGEGDRDGNGHKEGENDERSGSGADHEGDGEEVEEQETAASAAESEPRTSLLVTLAPTSETGKACLQAIGIAGGRRTRKRFYEQPAAEQSAAGPSGRKKARREILDDDEASAQLSSALVATPAAEPTLELVEKGNDGAEVSMALAGALTDMSIVETHAIAPLPAGQFEEKDQDVNDKASAVLTDKGKDDTEVSASLAELIADKSPIEDSAASSKLATQAAPKFQEKSSKHFPSLTSKPPHKKQTKLDAIFTISTISRKKPNGKKQCKINQLFPVLRSTREKKVFCTCRGPDIGFMIYCEGPCKEWYHGRCVGVTAKDGKKMEKYFCKSCTTALAAAMEDAAAKDDEPLNTLDPKTAPDLIVEESPTSPPPTIQLSQNPTPLKNPSSPSSIAPAAPRVFDKNVIQVQPPDLTTARLKITHPTTSHPAPVPVPQAKVLDTTILSTNTPTPPFNVNAEHSFLQVLQSFTALNGGAIRFDFGSGRDIFDEE